MGSTAMVAVSDRRCQFGLNELRASLDAYSETTFCRFAVTGCRGWALPKIGTLSVCRNVVGAFGNAQVYVVSH